jgi:hypothetical protein
MTEDPTIISPPLAAGPTDPMPPDPLLSVVSDLARIAETHTEELHAVARVQTQQTQLLLAQARVLREVQELLTRYSPMLERWASSPAAKLAGLVRRGGE